MRHTGPTLCTTPAPGPLLSLLGGGSSPVAAHPVPHLCTPSAPDRDAHEATHRDRPPACQLRRQDLGAGHARDPEVARHRVSRHLAAHAISFPMTPRSPGWRLAAVGGGRDRAAVNAYLSGARLCPESRSGWVCWAPQVATANSTAFAGTLVIMPSHRQLTVVLRAHVGGLPTNLLPEAPAGCPPARAGRVGHRGAQRPANRRPRSRIPLNRSEPHVALRLASRQIRASSRIRGRDRLYGQTAVHPPEADFTSTVSSPSWAGYMEPGSKINRCGSRRFYCSSA